MKEKFPEVELIYKNPTKVYKRKKVASAEDIVEYFREKIADTIDYKEYMFAIFMNRSNHVLGYKLIGVGSSSTCVVSTREVMQAAILIHAESIILVHNHPSGNLTPSNEDINFTRKLKDCAHLFEMYVLDHLIITSEGYESFIDRV